MNHKYFTLLAIELLILIPIPVSVFATDFGKHGATYKVIEEPFIQMLKKRLEGLDIEHEKQKIQSRAKAQVENPSPVSGISPATKDRVFYFDPNYTLDKDATLPCGKILHKAGTKVNPLAHIDFNRRLFFIDGRNEAQITWLKEQLAQPLPKQEQEKHKEQVEDRIVLVAGSVFKLQEILGETHADKVYFDQAGELTTKFGIRAAPAIATQEGLKLRIEEVVVNYVTTATDEKTYKD